ncbi:hypothetical protein FOMPIDRAFT_1060274 [Fomitopsis schrenkii]|uniref:Uncharacterized protein n=1 Tax=Fomitopsis schrenkii TaxID=2126942 RepID=S8FGD5_FOMSC|nr:hypothetical protein FOMPIDRAFT_1060274 [Fomitopsis schrenkii]
MSTSASFFRTLPAPPTTNTLDPRDRTRLVRSARKLGNVLGTTPQVVEQDPRPANLLPIGAASSTSRPSTPFSLRSNSPSSRPSTPGSIYSSSSTNSSMASLALPTPRTSSESLAEPAKGYSTTRGRRSKELPRPLVLRLNAVPMPPNDWRAAHTRVHGAANDYLDAPSDADALPPTPSTARSASCPPVTPTTPVPPTAVELRRKRMAKLTRTLGENVPLDLVFPTTPATSTPSTAATERAIPPPPQSAVTAVERARRRRSMSVDMPQAAASVLAAPRNSRIWVTGGSLWTGEWNRRDISEVQNQLRRLR